MKFTDIDIFATSLKCCVFNVYCGLRVLHLNYFEKITHYLLCVLTSFRGAAQHPKAGQNTLSSGNHDHKDGIQKIYHDLFKEHGRNCSSSCWNSSEQSVVDIDPVKASLKSTTVSSCVLRYYHLTSNIVKFNICIFNCFDNIV